MTDHEQEHWDEAYVSKADGELRWFQARPSTSVRLVGLAAHGGPGASVIDVGVLEHDEREQHHTPTGGTQASTRVVLRRR